MAKKLIKHPFGGGSSAASTSTVSSSASGGSAAATATPQAPQAPNPPSSRRRAAARSSSQLPPPAPALAALLPVSITRESRPLPRLVVFDLDFTLWPFWVDTHPTPPLRAAAAAISPDGVGGGGASATATAVTDRHGEAFCMYDDAPSILWALPQLGMRVAVASRTAAPDLAREMLKLMLISPPPPPPPQPQALEDGPPSAGSIAKKEKPRRAIEFFDGGLEIYPGSKLAHMQALSKKAAVPFEDILFFDDESRNREVERLGVTMRLVTSGITWAELEAGVEEWRRRRAGGDGDR